MFRIELIAILFRTLSISPIFPVHIIDVFYFIILVSGVRQPSNFFPINYYLNMI